MPPKYVYGSGRLNPRATAVGVRNTLRRLSRAGHIPFESNARYADTTFGTIRDFLRPVLRLAGTPLAARPGRGVPATLAYPLPAHDYVDLTLPANWHDLGDAQLLDLTGRVVRRLTPQAQQLRVSCAGLAAGSYFWQLAGQPAVKLVFN